MNSPRPSGERPASVFSKANGCLRAIVRVAARSASASRSLFGIGQPYACVYDVSRPYVGFSTCERQPTRGPRMEPCKGIGRPLPTIRCGFLFCSRSPDSGPAI